VPHRDLNEVKDIADKMKALKCANHRQPEINAAELCIRAERRLGQMMNTWGLKGGASRSAIGS
jgi:hypothetical protein